MVLRAEDAESAPGAALVAKDPYTTFAKIAALFDIAPTRPPGIHPSAVIDPSAQVAASAHIGPFVSVGARSVVGENCIIGAGSVIGEDCSPDSGCELIARVTLVTRVRLGKRVRVHPGAVLGADGFGPAMDAGKWIKVPQLGGVRIGDDCEIGANTCVDRGALEDTVLDEDVRPTTWCRSRTTCRSVRIRPSPVAPASPAAPRSAAIACSAATSALSATGDLRQGRDHRQVGGPQFHP